MEAKVVRWGEDLAIKLTADEVRTLGVHEGQIVEVIPKIGSIAPSVDISPTMGQRYVSGLRVYTLAEMIAEMRRLGPENEPETVDWGPDRGSEIIDDDDDPC